MVSRMETSLSEARFATMESQHCLLRHFRLGTPEASHATLTCCLGQMAAG